MRVVIHPQSPPSASPTSVWNSLTPDSFSDGGQFTSVESAIDFGVRMHQQGASLIDVGGESTRPGADRVAVAEELDRVMPVIEGLVTARVPVSIDTMNAETATVCDSPRRKVSLPE